MREPLLVLFGREDGQLCGEILTDLKERRKPVYLKHGSRVRPATGELWRCRILREEYADEAFIGDLFVEITQRYDASFIDPLRALSRLRSADGHAVRLGLNVKRILLHFPGYAAAISESISRFYVDGMRSDRLAHTMNLGHPVGIPTVAQATHVGNEESATFARWKDTDRIVRITKLDTRTWSGNPHTTFRLVRNECPSEVMLQDFALGRHNWGNPQQMNDRDHRERALRFWRQHAYVFDPTVFDPPFQATWHSILNDRPQRKPRQKESCTRLKAAPSEHRPTYQPEGPLILPEDETG